MFCSEVSPDVLGLATAGVLSPGCDVSMRVDSYSPLRAEAGGGALPGERWRDIGLSLEEANLRLRQAGVRS